MKNLMKSGVLLNLLLLPTAYCNDGENGGIIAGIVVGAVVVLGTFLCIFATYVYCNCKRLKHTWPSNINSEEAILPKADQLESSGSFVAMDDDRYASGELSLVFANANAPTHEALLEELNFPRTAICLIKDIGNWTVGMVYQGEATGIKETELSTTVLVKSLHERASRKVKERFLAEMKWVIEFNHPNVITLLGTCVKNEPMYLIYEYLEYGPLNTFLQSVSSASTGLQMLANVADRDISSSPMSGALNQSSDVLTIDDLFSFAIQIASGMEHITSKGFIHKDLAARSCHVSQRLQVKIANFGFSKDINSPDYYHMQTPKTLIPVRWLAPECLKEGKYNTPTDVWAYGVTAWEIFSYGGQPYSGLSDVEAYKCITLYEQLEKPRECPDVLYQLMHQCWEKEPPMRPSFNEIISNLRDMQKTSNNPNVSFESTDLKRLATML